MAVLQVGELSRILKEYLKHLPKTDVDSIKEYLRKFIGRRDHFIRSADKYGTPQFFLDESRLRERAEFFKDTMRKSIPDSEFFYAFKCNDLPYIAKFLKKKGYYADVAGIFELRLALKLGFARIIFTGPGKSEEEIIIALKNCDRVIVNIDNEDELKRLNRLIKRTKFKKKLHVGIRVNPDEKITKEWAKFGITINRLHTVIKKVNENPHLVLKGLHFHTSWNKTPERHVNNIKLLGEYLKMVPRKELLDLSFIDVGGGFVPEMEGTFLKGTPLGKMIGMMTEMGEKAPKIELHDFYVEKPVPLNEFAKAISSALEKYIFKYMKRRLTVYFEPGRYIVKNSTMVLTRVLAVKKRGIVVDGGANIIGDDALYDWEFVPILNISKPSFDFKKVRVFGSLCDPSDVFGFSYFGEKAKVGDLMVILNLGAYTFSWSRRFIKPIAPYIVLNSNKNLVVAKSIETFEDRYRGCRI